MSPFPKQPYDPATVKTADLLSALTAYLTTVQIVAAYQPLDADLTAIAAITGTGYLQRTGVNTWSLGSPTTTDASLLTSGTLADARLSANVAMRNSANTFTANQAVTGNITASGTIQGGADLRLSADGAFGTRLTTTAGSNGFKVSAFGGTNAFVNLGYIGGGSSGLGISAESVGLGSTLSPSVFITSSGSFAEINNGTLGTYLDFKARNITASGSFKPGIKTIATLPSAASSTGERYQLSDSATVVNRVAFSNGSAWYYEGTAVAA